MHLDTDFIILSRDLRGWVLPSHSLSAALQGTSVSWRGALHTAGALAFVAAVQQMPLYHLVLVAVKGFAFLGATELWQLERWFLAGQCTGLRHIPQAFCERERGLFVCPGSLT